MASPLVSRTPQCMSCIRRMTGSLENASQFPGRQQIRHKKKLAKVSTVKVHLLQNIPGYGRRGAVIPATAGMMRNIWYPKKMAEYVTAAKQEELGVKKDALFERDSTFGTREQRKLERKQDKRPEKKSSDGFTQVVIEEAPEPIELELPSPEQATSILDELLPQNIDFYRTPITIALPTKRVSPSIPVTSTISAAAAQGKESEKTGKTSIYGSVSTSDIAANLKAILAEDEQGARVLLAPEDISFMEETDDKDRVKHLGVFKIDIRAKGASDAVRRTIKVNAQD